MLSIPGYQVSEQLYSGNHSMVYRGFRLSDNHPAVFKLLKNAYPSLNEVAKLRQEYEMLRQSKAEGMIEVYGLEKYNNGLVMIEEDIGGDSLANHLSQSPLGITTFLEIAIALCHTVGSIHQNQIIHKNINPSNIIWNPQTRILKLIDFGVSTRLSWEIPSLLAPGAESLNALEDTLAYISPEQTGRMNRDLDYRTDFYSLGATLYHLLIGHPPFQAKDVMELVHSHIALLPKPPHTIRTEAPEILSRILLKLMSKNAEDRYHTAFGVKSDLQKCLQDWQITGTIHPFDIGQEDVSERFHIPQRLYGREQETTALLEAFERVQLGEREFFLISGYSGVGKSALVHELYRPITEKRGYFLEGKFEQYQRDLPYSAWIRAFQGWTSQLMTENATQLEGWKKRILKATGNHAKVLIDLIPDLELILGPQPAMPELGGMEAQNRFNYVFRNFLIAISRPQHPIVIFLDDLQWADSASLKLLRLLLTDPEIAWFFVIGAFRDKGVAGESFAGVHQWVTYVKDLKRENVRIEHLDLQNLGEADVNTLIAETLICGPSESQPLAELIYNKTDGNAFFVHQMFKSLYENHSLVFDTKTRRWQWDIEELKSLNIADNVVALMTGKILRLPAQTQNFLKWAACIGNRFDLSTLSIIAQTTEEAAHEGLQQALREGYLLLIENHFKFAHDRIQQVIYSSIPQGERKNIHLKIGRLLLQNKFPLPDTLFQMADHLNFGGSLITEKEEKISVAQLNLTAGQRALGAAAYREAAQYLKNGIALIDIGAWKEHYDLTFNLHFSLLQVHHLVSDYEQVASFAETILQQTERRLDRVKVEEIKIHGLIAQNKMEAAVQLGYRVLEELEIPLQKQPVLYEEPIQSLQHQPEMTDPLSLAAMRILMAIEPPTYIANPGELSAVIYTMVDLCIQQGNSSLAPFAYCFYGLLLCGDDGNPKMGYEYGKLALNLLQQLESKEIECKVYDIYNAGIRPWNEHACNSLVPLQETLQIGLETGDIEFGGYAINNYATIAFLTGHPLNALSQDLEQYIALLQKLKQDFSLNYTWIWQQLTLNLQEEPQDRKRFETDFLQENKILPLFHKTNNFPSLFAFHLAKGMLHFVFKDTKEALVHLNQALEFGKTVSSKFLSTYLPFYHSLVLLTLYPHATKQEQEKMLQEVNANQKKFEAWMVQVPVNFQHKYDLVEAKKHEILGATTQAMHCFEKAIQGAGTHGYFQEEALSYELAGEFYLNLGIETFAHLYLQKAHQGYTHWQAWAKVKDLEKQYPQWFFSSTTDMPRSLSTSETDPNLLDWNTIMKASQTLAGEITLAGVLKNMMTIMIENAGARKGILLLKKGEVWVIEAEQKVGDEETTLLQSLPLESQQNEELAILPVSIVNYVMHTKEPLIVEDAAREQRFLSDSYLVQYQPKSLLCLPILHHGAMMGILYLENALATGSFTSDHLEVLNLLSSQAAISIENAMLYQELEQRVEERTEELQNSLKTLRQTQAQLVTQEKLASLGKLTAGIAHEINNPLNFVINFAEEGENLTKELQEELQKAEKDRETSVEELLKMLGQVTHKVHDHAKRVENIIQAMLLHSRGSRGVRQPSNLNILLEEFTKLAYSSMRAKAPNFHVRLEFNFDPFLPKIEVVPQDLCRAFLNVVNNALFAAQEKLQEANKDFSPLVKVGTRDLKDSVEIRIWDNGKGIPKEQIQQIFEPFYTTKFAGAGTGLGLSLSYEIVVQEHQGSIDVESKEGEFTEFILSLPK